MSVPYAGGYLGLGNSFTSQNRAPPFVGGWVEVGRATSAGSTSTMQVSSIPLKRYYMVLYSDAGMAGAPARFIRCNSDAGTNYSRRLSFDGAADITAVSQTAHNGFAANNVWPQFAVQYYSNLAAKEKLMMSQNVTQNTAGAANAPVRDEYVGKWTNTSTAINDLTVTVSSGNFNSGDQIVVLGWDPADTHTDNFWEELASVDLSGGAANNIDSGTITAKKYLWIEIFAEVTASSNGAFTFNADTAGNYAIRVSGNGAADSTFASLSNLNFQGTVDTKPVFQNAFIINIATKEKLMTGNNIDQGTAGAANAPNRKEYAGKWANTSNQITAINYKSNSATTFGTNTFMRIWGSD